MNTKEITAKLNSMYDVKEVKTGYQYWFMKFLNYTLQIFGADGLTPELPLREIEANLILTGHDVVFDHKSKLTTTETTLSGVGRFYLPTNAIYAEPALGSGNLKIGEDCVIIWNSSLKNGVLGLPMYGGLYDFIARYARTLADLESTFNIYTVNGRLTAFPVASTDSVISSIKKFFGGLALGRQEIITDNAVINQFRTVDIMKSSVSDKAYDWLIARDKVLEDFFKNIGVRSYIPKKAQVNTEELETDNKKLLISISDMLKCRKEGAEAINKMFGTDIRYYINEEFLAESKENMLKGENENDK